MIKFFSVIFIIVFILVYALPSVAFSKQILLLDSLKQISSIVLAITGAWAAIIYPESLKNIMTKQKSSDKDMDSIAKLLTPMITSFIILGFIVLLEISAFILKTYGVPIFYIPYLRDISLFIIIYLYVLQIWTLLVTLIPINDIYRNAKHNQGINDYIDEVNK